MGKGACALVCPPGKFLFSFPSKENDEERRKKWLDYFDMEDPNVKILFACERHFSNKQRSGNNMNRDGVPDIPIIINIPGPYKRKLKNWSSNVIVVTPRDPEFFIYKNQTGIFSQDQFQYGNYVQLPVVTNSIQLPILQPKTISTPTIKTVACSMFTQTDTRLCGSVQISVFLDEYRLNCFYCCESFALEKWFEFVDHLKQRHFENEQAFEIVKYPYGDHDYTTVRSQESEVYNTRSLSVKDLPLETTPPPLQPKPMESKDKPFNVGMAETLIKLLDETLLNPNFRHTEEDNIVVIKSNCNNNIKPSNVLKKIITTKTAGSPEILKTTFVKNIQTSASCTSAENLNIQFKKKFQTPCPSSEDLKLPLINQETTLTPCTSAENLKRTFTKRAQTSTPRLNHTNRRIRKVLLIRPTSSRLKRFINKPTSDTESEFETESTPTTSQVLGKVTPNQSNAEFSIPQVKGIIVKKKSEPIAKKVGQQTLMRQKLPLQKLIVKNNGEPIAKKVVQQTLKNIKDFEAIYKTVKTRPLRTTSTLRPPRTISSGIFYIKNIGNNTVTEKQTSNKTALNRCLKRANTETNDSLSQNPQVTNPSTTELVFQFTPKEIIMDLLDAIKDYPILWEFHKEANNKDYAKTIHQLCEKINQKWSLNLTVLQMRRSINRILTYYRYMLPCEKVEMFPEYFEKCSQFLPSTVDEIPRKRCEYCDICFANDSDMRKHLVEEHKYLKWQYKCNHCLDRFVERNEYELHKRLPHFIGVFVCHHCNKIFNRRRLLNKHAKCHESPVSKTQVSQVTHPQEMHTCDICHKEFKSRSDLAAHKIYHEEKRFKCHLCLKSFYQKTTLTVHLKRHRQQLDYVCEYCGKAFVKQSYLNTHIETHTGAKVICNICNLKLRKCSLTRHLRLVHVACEGTIESTFRAKSYHYKKHTQSNYRPRPFNRTKEVGPRKYDCKKCNIPFERLKLLKEHNNEIHSNVKIMHCKICSIAFRHRHNIRYHYREKHKLHPIQIAKLLDYNEDLDKVLNLKIEDLLQVENNEWIDKQEQPPLDHADEQQHTNLSSSLQDEIMKAVENIDEQEIIIDDGHAMNDFFANLLTQE